MDNLRIKIYTRSMNLALYNRAMFFIDLPYPKVRLTGTSADGYLYQLIRDEEADIVINIDEDAFVTDLNALKELLDYVIENKYINCGMPDGGIAHLRRLHPLVTNPYFNILNVKEIRKQFSEEAVNEFPFHKEEYMNVMPQGFLKGGYEIVDYEPYYKLFIWMSQHFKTLYLNAETHPDGISTLLYDHHNQPFLTHTWYSRMYNNDTEHTTRINNVVKECEGLHNKKYHPTFNETKAVYRQKFYNFYNRRLKRFIKPIKDFVKK